MSVNPSVLTGESTVTQYNDIGFPLCWVKFDGSLTYDLLKAENDSAAFVDHGDYLIPLIWDCYD